MAGTNATTRRGITVQISGPEHPWVRHIPIRCRIINKSGTSVSRIEMDGLIEWFLYVRDSAGNEPPLTSNGQKKIPAPAVRSGVVMNHVDRGHLAAGEEFSVNIDIAELFVLQPGSYVVCISPRVYVGTTEEKFEVELPITVEPN